jgi:hypothetical protein
MIDLHMHSTASDGTLAPAELVGRAYESGVRVMALTDHDTLDGFPEASDAARKLGMEIVPAAEVTTTLTGRTCHILAYFQDYDQASETARWLSACRTARDERLEETCSRLRKLGIAIEASEVRQVAGRAAVHRPHVARTLFNKGIVKSVEEAFRRFLKDGGPAHVKFESIDARAALWRLREEGAYTSLAHATVDRFGESHIRMLAEQGLHAVEVYHSEHSPSDRRALKEICDRFDLEATGGSDFHGDAKCRFYRESSEERGVPLAVSDRLFEGICRARDLAPAVRKQHGSHP